MNPLTNSQLAYQHLRRQLLAGEYKPGTRILYGPVGKQLGISATPVREAIGLLAHEGLVELVPQLGAVVRKLSQQELIELYELREAIEPYAARKAAERATEEHLKTFREHYQAMTDLMHQWEASQISIPNAEMIASFEQHDLAFHMQIIASAGNQMLVKTAESSNALTRVFSTKRHDYDINIMKTTCVDHERILHALESRSPEHAAAAMHQHIQNGLTVSLNNFLSSN